MTGQVKRVFEFMQDGAARTLDEVAKALGISEASVGARLRDLRKPAFGGYTVQREKFFTSKNVYTYAVTDALRA